MLATKHHEQTKGKSESPPEKAKMSTEAVPNTEVNPIWKSLATHVSGHLSFGAAGDLLPVQRMPLSNERPGPYAHKLGNRPDGRLIQTKLTIGRPDNEYEREADAVAELVMRMPASAPPRAVPTGSSAAVFAPKEQNIQTKSNSGQSLEVSPQLAIYLREPKDSGQPLQESTRTSMESRFGREFDQVRVHTGEAAAKVSESIRARAFTFGQNIYFGNGEYQPGTLQGQRLLAHELTHTVQQRGRQSETSLHEEDQNKGSSGTTTEASGIPESTRNAPVHGRGGISRMRKSPTTYAALKEIGTSFSHLRVERTNSEPLIMRTEAGAFIDQYRTWRGLALNERGLGDALRVRLQSDNYSESSIELVSDVLGELREEDKHQVAYWLVIGRTGFRLAASGERGRLLLRWVRDLLDQNRESLLSAGNYASRAQGVRAALDWAESRRDEAQPPEPGVRAALDWAESIMEEEQSPEPTEEEAPEAPQRAQLAGRWEEVETRSTEPRILVFSFPVTSRRARRYLGLGPVPSPADTSEVRGTWLRRHFGEQEGPILVAPAQSTEQINPEDRHTRYQVMVWVDWRESEPGLIRSIPAVEYRFREDIQPRRSELSYGDRRVILTVNRQVVRSEQPFAYQLLPPIPARNYPIIRLVVSPGVSIETRGFPQVRDETSPRVEIYRVQDADLVPTQGEPIRPSDFVGFETIRHEGATTFGITTIRRRPDGVDIVYEPDIASATAPGTVSVSITVPPRVRTARFAYEVRPPDFSDESPTTQITVVASPSTAIRIRGMRPGEYRADPLIRLYEAAFRLVPTQGESLSSERAGWHPWRGLQFEPEPLSQIVATSAADVLIGAIPIVGDLVDVVEFTYGLFTGQDRWGRPLTVTDLSLMAIGTLIPLVGASALRAGATAVRSADEIADLAQTMGRSSDEVTELVLRVGRLAPEEQARVSRWTRMIRRGEEVPEDELSEIERIVRRVDEGLPAGEATSRRAEEAAETAVESGVEEVVPAPRRGLHEPSTRLSEARAWAARTIQVPASILRQLSRQEISRLRQLPARILERLSELNPAAQRRALGCNSPCRVDLDEIRGSVGVEARTSEMQRALSSVRDAQRRMDEATQDLRELESELRLARNQVNEALNSGSTQDVETAINVQRMVRRRMRQAHAQLRTARPELIEAQRQQESLIQSVQDELSALHDLRTSLLAPHRGVTPPYSSHRELNDELANIRNQEFQLNRELDTLRRQLRGEPTTLEGRWRLHEAVVDNLVRSRYSNVVSQKFMWLTSSTGRRIRIQPDNLVLTDSGRYLIIDAKWSDNFDLRAGGARPTLTAREAHAYPEIANGRLTTATFENVADAREIGLVSGREIDLEPRVEIWTNASPEGGFRRFDYTP